MHQTHLTRACDSAITVYKLQPRGVWYSGILVTPLQVCLMFHYDAVQSEFQDELCFTKTRMIALSVLQRLRDLIFIHWDTSACDRHSDGKTARMTGSSTAYDFIVYSLIQRSQQTGMSAVHICTCEVCSTHDWDGFIFLLRRRAIGPTEHGSSESCFLTSVRCWVDALTLWLYKTQ